MLDQTLERFFDQVAPLEVGDTLVVAFSGGPDSTALLSAAARLGRSAGFRVVAAHLDHGLDPDSKRRAEHAESLATTLGAPFVTERAEPAGEALKERGIEDWARRRRYAFLERVRVERRARWVATAHHRDDQIETVLLLLLLGTGLQGLGAIEPRRGTVVRPLLDAGRADLSAELADHDLRAIDDPTNREVRPRTLVRHGLAPHLLAEAPGTGDLLVRVAASARRVSDRLGRHVEGLLELQVEDDPRSGAPTASVDLARLKALPPEVRAIALARLHRRVGSPYPAGEAARGELERQLAAGGRIGADCGDGWRWLSLPRNAPAERLALRFEVAAPTPAFTYTLRIPGDVTIPELDLSMSVAWEPIDAWVFEGRRRRAALDLPVMEGDRLVVRNRRPGDRLRPLGCGYRKRLKEVLIDAGVPREDRDRLPLLCLGNRIAWIPGLTIDETYRIKGQTHAWIARIEPTAGNAERTRSVVPDSAVDDGTDGGQ